MEINFTYDRPEEGPGSAPLTVGWFLAQMRFTDVLLVLLIIKV